MKSVVCVDDTRASKKAIREAVKFAELTDSSVTLLHSVEKEAVGNASELVQEGDNAAIDRGQKMVDSLVEYAHNQSEGDVDISGDVVLDDDGDSVRAVLDYVNQNSVDQIFVGHRALDERQERLFGSFTKDMIGSVRIPTTVVTPDRR